jgi:hypothetical protein
MQVAVRKPSKGTLITLWLHENFAVYQNKAKRKGKRELDIFKLWSSGGAVICLPNVKRDCPIKNLLKSG